MKFFEDHVRVQTSPAKIDLDAIHEVLEARRSIKALATSTPIQMLSAANIQIEKAFRAIADLQKSSTVFFQLRSFAFNEMDQNEADEVYETAKNICAQHLGVDPGELEAKAKQRSF